MPTVKIRLGLFFFVGTNCKAIGLRKIFIDLFCLSICSVGKLTNRIVQNVYRYFIDLLLIEERSRTFLSVSSQSGFFPRGLSRVSVQVLKTYANLF